MTKTFDNALTRAQVALENGVPSIREILELDFANNDINWVQIRLSFTSAYGKRQTFKSKIPVHLIFDYERLIHVVRYWIKTYDTQLSGDNDLQGQKIKDNVYLFPTANEIIEKLRSVDNRGGMVDKFFASFADRVAGQMLSYKAAGSAFFGTPDYVMDRDTAIGTKEWDQLWDISQNPHDYYRALFNDAPHFAEYIIGQTFKGKDKERMVILP